jgi:hypothetical protein
MTIKVTKNSEILSSCKLVELGMIRNGLIDNGGDAYCNKDRVKPTALALLRNGTIVARIENSNNFTLKPIIEKKGKITIIDTEDEIVIDNQYGILNAEFVVRYNSSLLGGNKSDNAIVAWIDIEQEV